MVHSYEMDENMTSVHEYEYLCHMEKMAAISMDDHVGYPMKLPCMSNYLDLLKRALHT